MDGQAKTQVVDGQAKTTKIAKETGGWDLGEHRKRREKSGKIPDFWVWWRLGVG